MKLAPRFIAFLLFGLDVWAQSYVAAPQVGAMIDTAGALRGVSGIAGSFVAGPTRAQHVRALACSRAFCVAQTDGNLITPRGIIPVPLGDAVLATNGGRFAAWFAQTREFFTSGMTGRTPELQSQTWTIDGQVLSMRPTPAGVDIAVRRDSAVWIVTSDGTVMDTLPPEASGAVLLLDDQVVYAAGTGVVVLHSDGSQTRFAIPSAPQALFRMGTDWVEILTREAGYALRISPGSEASGTTGLRVGQQPIYLLPGATLEFNRPRQEGP